MSSASRSSVAQFSVSASQLIKLIKPVSSLVLKKRIVTTIVCVLLRKAPTKNMILTLCHISHFFPGTKNLHLSIVTVNEFINPLRL